MPVMRVFRPAATPTSTATPTALPPPTPTTLPRPTTPTGTLPFAAPTPLLARHGPAAAIRSGRAGAGSARTRPGLGLGAGLVIGALVAGCSTTRLPPRAAPSIEPDASAVVAPAPAPGTAASPGAPPSASRSPRGGAYYLDDGPGHLPMPPVETLVDATPRAEPLHPRANRPYQVFGRDYVPLTERTEFRERGTASWYGRKFHGRLTSTGEPYDMYAMTAAHPTLPLPSYVRVTNLTNGRAVVVRVNDRGPFLRGRVIDLSAAAAWRLGYLDAGSAQVEVELIGTAVTDEGQAALGLLTGAGSAPAPAPAATVAASRTKPREGAETAAPAAPRPTAAPLDRSLPPILVTATALIDTEATADRQQHDAAHRPAAAVSTEAALTASAPTETAPVDAGSSSIRTTITPVAPAAAHAPATAATATSALGGPSAAVPGSPSSSLATDPAVSAVPPPSGLFVQLAAFQSREAADGAVARLGAELGADAPLRVVPGAAVYRVQAGPYPDRQRASAAADRIKRVTGLRPWVVGPP